MTIIETCRFDLAFQFANPGQHAHQPAHAAHLLELAQLAEKIVHVELALGHAAGQTLGFISLNRFRCLFDKADNIAHAENPAGHAFSIKFFQCILFFANTEKLDRAAGDMTDRKRRTPTAVTICTGQNNTGNPHSITERFGCCHRILTCQRIGNEQDFGRLGNAVDLTHFVHQCFIDSGPAGGIQNKHISRLKLGRLQGAFGDGNRRVPILFGQNSDISLTAKQTQLLPRGRTCHVKRRQHDIFFLL